MGNELMMPMFEKEIQMETVKLLVGVFEHSYQLLDKQLKEVNVVLQKAVEAHGAGDYAHSIELVVEAKNTIESISKDIDLHLTPESSNCTRLSLALIFTYIYNVYNSNHDYGKRDT